MHYKVIISTQVKDETPYLDEWVNYHLGIGIEHIVIYDNMSDPPLKNVWGDKVTVILNPRPFTVWSENIPHFETLQNFDCEWMARIDIDEFIVMYQHSNIADLVDPYSEFGGLGLNWRIYGTSGHIEKPEGNVRDNYLWRVPDTFRGINGGNSHVKTIINAKYCLDIRHPHFPISSRPVVNEDFVPFLDAFTDSSRKLAVINHYVTKSRSEWIFKTDRGWGGGNEGIRRMEDLEDIDRNCIIFDPVISSVR